MEGATMFKDDRMIAPLSIGLLLVALGVVVEKVPLDRFTDLAERVGILSPATVVTHEVPEPMHYTPPVLQAPKLN